MYCSCHIVITTIHTSLSSQQHPFVSASPPATRAKRRALQSYALKYETTVERINERKDKKNLQYKTKRMQQNVGTSILHSNRANTSQKMFTEQKK